VFVRGTARPAGWSKIAPTAKGAFPGRAFASVRGFAFSFAAEGLGLDGTERGCTSEDEYGQRVVSERGELCPSVVLPGAALDLAQQQALVELATSPPQDEINASLRCGFDPHHAFVFYDAADRPIGEIIVCFTCGEWRTHPAVRQMPKVMSASTARTLRAMCRSLELPGCAAGELEDLDESVYREGWSQAKKRYAAEAPPRAFDPATLLSDLGASERRELCLTRLAGRRLVGHGYECLDGKKIVFGDWRGLSACDERPPSGVTVGALDRLFAAFPDEGDVCAPAVEQRRAALEAVRGYTLGISLSARPM
jgi:hypothetical protein